MSQIRQADEPLSVGGELYPSKVSILTVCCPSQQARVTETCCSEYTMMSTPAWNNLQVGFPSTLQPNTNKHNTHQQQEVSHFVICLCCPLCCSWVRHAWVDMTAGWVPPSLSTFSAAPTAAEPVQVPAPAALQAAAAVQPSALQVSGQAVVSGPDHAEIVGPEPASRRSLVGLQSYGSDFESDTTSSGGSAPVANGQSLGPFF